MWQTIELPDGTVMEGIVDYRGTQGDRFLLPKDLSGKSVLDFGTFDGFWAIEAKKRGASEVLAMDRWNPPLETTKLALGLYKIEYKYSGDLDFALPDHLIKKFDIVLFYGILYHLKNPYMGLLNASQCCKQGGMVIVESAVNQGEMELLPKHIPLLWVIDVIHHNDPTNYFMPNELAIIQLCKMVGLEQEGEITWTKQEEFTRLASIFRKK